MFIARIAICLAVLVVDLSLGGTAQAAAIYFSDNSLVSRYVSPTGPREPLVSRTGYPSTDGFQMDIDPVGQRGYLLTLTYAPVRMHGILMFALDGSAQTYLPLPTGIELGTHSGQDIDLVHGRLFFKSCCSYKISSIKLDGSDFRTIDNPSVSSSFHAIAVDPVGSRVFYSAIELPVAAPSPRWTMFQVGYDGSGFASIFSAESIFPDSRSFNVLDMDYDPIHNELYWSFSDSHGSQQGFEDAQAGIKATNLSTGLTRDVFIFDWGFGEPSPPGARADRILVDSSAEELWWLDNSQGIYRGDFNGLGFERIVGPGAGGPTGGIAVGPAPEISSAIPEPASLALLGLGLAGLALSRRTRT